MTSADQTIPERTQIEVVISPDCPMCEFSRDLVAQAVGLRPAADIVFVDVREIQGGEPVIATPTYRIGGRTMALGNPDLTELLSWIDKDRGS